MSPKCRISPHRCGWWCRCGCFAPPKEDREMPEYSSVRRVQYLGLAVVLAVSSLGAGACKPGKKKRKSKSGGVTTSQTSPAPTSPGIAPVQDNGLANKPPKVILTQVATA